MLRTPLIVVAAFAVSSSTHAQTMFTAKWKTGERRTYVIEDAYESKFTVDQES